MHWRDVNGAVQEGRAAARLGLERSKNPYASCDGYASLAQAWYSGYDGEQGRQANEAKK